MADDVARILSAIPIENYISRFVSLKRKGHNFWGLCPFHSEKTPSFSVSPEKGIFKCFGCGVGGNVFSFVQEYEKISFTDALKLLAEQAGIRLQGRSKSKKIRSYDENKPLEDVLEWVNEIYHKHIHDELPQNYLKERKIDFKTQKIFSLGFAVPKYHFLETELAKSFTTDEKEKKIKILHQLGLVSQSAHAENDSYERFRDRLTFPIHDPLGKIIGFGGRILSTRNTMAKYVNSTDSKLFHKKKSLYNIHRAKNSIRENNMVILVEGYFDVIGLYQKDIKNVVAPLGTSFTDEQARLIKRFTDQMVIFFDSDDAGKQAAFKALITAKRHKIVARVVHQVEKSKDPFDIAMENDEIDILTMIDSAKDEMSFILWYYFFHQYGTHDFEEKKKAIYDFFSYLKENVEQLWEQLDFIKEASSILEIEAPTLQYDFKLFLKGNQKIYLSPAKNKVQTKEVIKIPKIEKDILAILLRFPESWSNELLLEQLNWSTREMYLLFNFFYDRLKSGEVWEWNQMGQVISLLPKELSSLLASIIIEFDQVLTDDKEQKNYSSYLKKMILQKKVNEIDSKINELQKQLNLAEKLETLSSDHLTVEFQTLIQEKKKIVDAL